MTQEIKWLIAKFDELTRRQIHDLFKIRQDVFILEQNCIYQDFDGLDFDSDHVLGFENDNLVAYARVTKPGTRYPELSIGRVITAKSHRRTGLGKDLMTNTLAFMQKKWPNENIRIMAQAYLENFYQSFGFQTVSPEPFIAEGLPHIEMLKTSY